MPTKSTKFIAISFWVCVCCASYCFGGPSAKYWKLYLTSAYGGGGQVQTSEVSLADASQDVLALITGNFQNAERFNSDNNYDKNACNCKYTDYNIIDSVTSFGTLGCGSNCGICSAGTATATAFRCQFDGSGHSNQQTNMNIGGYYKYEFSQDISPEYFAMAISDDENRAPKTYQIHYSSDDSTWNQCAELDTTNPTDMGSSVIDWTSNQDGIVHFLPTGCPEACDDGNSVNGDGCSSGVIESGWNCNGNPSVCVQQIIGCMDATSANHNPQANVHNACDCEPDITKDSELNVLDAVLLVKDIIAG